MTGWIKLDKDLINDPRVLQAAVTVAGGYTIARWPDGSDPPPSELLRFWCNAVTGALVTLWKYADQHIRNDDTLPIALQTIDAMVGIQGFCAALPHEWIHELDDGTTVLPGYCKKNSLITQRKAREQSNARVARWRANQKASSNGVTHALHQRNSSVTKVVDQDQDQDLKSVTAGKPPRRTVPRETEVGAFEKFKTVYPARAGDPNWRGAIRAARARRAEKHEWAEMQNGAERYAKFCAATGKVGTEHVQQASRFLGPSKPFLLPWVIPAKPAFGNGREPPRDPVAEVLEAAKSLRYARRPGEPTDAFVARFRAWNEKRIAKLTS